MVKMVIIDPGHGGHDPGASEKDLIEKNMALQLGKMIADRLTQQYNVDVRMTRDTDRFIELSERANYANQLGADYFVSIHHNRAGGNGFESYIYPGTQNGAAGQMQKTVHNEIMAFMSKYNVRDRGRKQANFAVLRETRMPAILLEYLFVDHIEDAKRLRDQTFMQGAAQATVVGIAKAMSLPTKANNVGNERGTGSNLPQNTQEDPPAWKTEAVNWLFQRGLLTDETWRTKVEEPVPLWALAIMLQRMESNLKGDE